MQLWLKDTKYPNLKVNVKIWYFTEKLFFIVMSQKWLATPLHNTIGCSSQPKTKAYLAGVGGDRDDVTTKQCRARGAQGAPRSLGAQALPSTLLKKCLFLSKSKGITDKIVLDYRVIWDDFMRANLWLIAWKSWSSRTSLRVVYRKIPQWQRFRGIWLNSS